MSGLSEGHGQYGGGGGGNGYHYRSDSYSGASYGSPDQGGYHGHDALRYSSMSRMMPPTMEQTNHRLNSYEMQATMQRYVLNIISNFTFTVVIYIAMI